jgi:signal transduction histidine kinase
MALLLNLVVLWFLSGAFTESLQTIQNVTVRQQVTALQMRALLRDAEAALYRYQIEGEVGFARQFENRLDEFEQEINIYESLATSEDEYDWIAELRLANNNARELGHELIERRDKQSSDLQTLEIIQNDTIRLLRDEIAPTQLESQISQEAVAAMFSSINDMSSAVTAFLTTSGEMDRVTFTEAAVSLQQHFDQFQSQPGAKAWQAELETNFTNYEATGSRLISGREQQQSMFAQFAVILFQISQQLIVDQIQPQTTQNLAEAELAITKALNRSIWFSVIITGVTAVIAIIGTLLLLRQTGVGLRGLLQGADRVAKGDLGQPIPITTKDELAQLAGTFNHMMRDLDSREQRLQANLSELEALRQVSLQLTSTLNPIRVMNTIVNSALDLVQATEVHIFLCDETGINPQFGASAQRLMSEVNHRRLPRPDGLVVKCAQTGQRQVINQAGQHPLYNDLEAQSWNIKAAAAYPLKLADHVLGVLNISLDDRDTFRKAELRIVQLFADQAAIALENARLYQNITDNETRLNLLVKQLAHVQEEERRLVGLDLHDGLTQILLSTNMHLNTFAALAEVSINGQAQAEFGLVRTRLKEAIKEVRWVVSELRPTELEDFGLVDALRMYAAKISEVENWQVEFSADLGQIELSPTVETAVFRITQEAINNVRKHAHTSKILVQLKNEADYITLKIQDWGCGFDLGDMSGENQQLGLIGMKERAALIGGELEIESQPDQGTIVRAKILRAVND